MWPIRQRLFLGDYRSGHAALEGATRAVAPSGEPAPFAGVVSLCPMPLFPGEELTGPSCPETDWLYHPIVDGGNGEAEFELALEIVLPFVKKRRELGNVLVHCAAGMSRSVSVVAALLCSEGSTVEDAFEEIAARKASALRADGFDSELLIAPAWEFRSCLRRLYTGRGALGAAPT